MAETQDDKFRTDGNVKGFRPSGAKKVKKEFQKQRVGDKRAAKKEKEEKKKQAPVVLVVPKSAVVKKEVEEENKGGQLSKTLKEACSKFKVKDDLLSDYRIDAEEEEEPVTPVPIAATVREKKKEARPRLDLMAIVWSHGASCNNTEEWMCSELGRDRWPQVKTVLERADASNETIRRVKSDFDNYLKKQGR
jgi:hypothetical protein